MDSTTNACLTGAYNGVGITSNVATQTKSRAVWIGTSQSLDFCFNGVDWVTFAGCVAGSILPLQVVGARITAATANPAANDVVFLY